MNTQTASIQQVQQTEKSEPIKIMNSAPVPTTTIHTFASSNPSQPIDSRENNLVEAIRRKLRATSFFQSLDREQARKLLAWFNEFDCLAEIHKRVTSAPPSGLGVEVSYTALRRFRASLDAAESVAFTDQINDTITEMHESGQLDGSTVQGAISQFIHQQAFRLALKDGASPSLTALLKNISHLATLEHKREKIRLERERLRLLSETHTQPRTHNINLTIARPNRELSINAAQLSTVIPSILEATPKTIDEASKQLSEEAMTPESNQTPPTSALSCGRSLPLSHTTDTTGPLDNTTANPSATPIPPNPEQPPALPAIPPTTVLADAQLPEGEGNRYG